MAEKADKSEIPTAIPIDGGNADTVNGHTVNADVPANAQFTDTVYTLPKATKTTLGGVKIGDNLSVTADGTLSAPFALEAIHQPSGQDLNDYITPGVYYFASDKTPTNIPAGVNGFLLVLADIDGRVKQIWFRQGTADVNDYQTYIRMGLGGNWSSWRQFETKEVPNTYAAATYGANQEQADEIMSQLSELDAQAMRPLRAVAVGTATDEDTDKLREIEAQAAILRTELAELEGGN